jgi:hypothetical protein
VLAVNLCNQAAVQQEGVDMCCLYNIAQPSGNVMQLTEVQLNEHSIQPIEQQLEEMTLPCLVLFCGPLYLTPGLMVRSTAAGYSIRSELLR